MVSGRCSTMLCKFLFFVESDVYNEYSIETIVYPSVRYSIQRFLYKWNMSVIWYCSLTCYYMRDKYIFYNACMQQSQVRYSVNTPVTDTLSCRVLHSFEIYITHTFLHLSFLPITSLYSLYIS